MQLELDFQVKKFSVALRMTGEKLSTEIEADNALEAQRMIQGYYPEARPVLVRVK